VAAELGLAGHTVLRMPDHWPDYHLIVQRAGLPPQTVRVASTYQDSELFDFLAVVVAPAGKKRAVYVVPREAADRLIPAQNGLRRWQARGMEAYRGEFTLRG
jgi:hypothetical protein